MICEKCLWNTKEMYENGGFWKPLPLEHKGKCTKMVFLQIFAFGIEREIYEMVIFDDVWPVLDELKSRNFSLGLLSNMNRSGNELLQEFNLSNHMTFAVTSLEVGVEKPYPLMFKKALEIAGVSGREALHVGDQIGSDIDGAEASAVRPILIDRDGNHPDFSRCPKISGMTQLSDVLNSLS